jgi:hypothetical protein
MCQIILNSFAINMEKQEVIYIRFMWLVLVTLKTKVKILINMNTHKKLHISYTVADFEGIMNILVSTPPPILLAKMLKNSEETACHPFSLLNTSSPNPHTCVGRRFTVSICRYVGSPHLTVTDFHNAPFP